jgi:hypothetical protein
MAAYPSGNGKDKRRRRRQGQAAGMDQSLSESRNQCISYT